MLFLEEFKMLTLEMKKEIIDEKMELLKQFGILDGRQRKNRSSVISILAECSSEIQMENCIYDMLHGKETLDNFINRHMPQLR
jgi:hypothetical protein